MDNKLSIEDFEKEFVLAFQEANKLVLDIRELSKNEVEEITKLCNKKYRTYEWNYGETPTFSKGIVDESNETVAILEIEQGIIQHVKKVKDNFLLNFDFLKNNRFDVDTIRVLLKAHDQFDTVSWLEKIFG